MDSGSIHSFKVNCYKMVVSLGLLLCKTVSSLVRELYYLGMLYYEYGPIPLIWTIECNVECEWIFDLSNESDHTP